jgi:hypothetical protein
MSEQQLPSLRLMVRSASLLSLNKLVPLPSFVSILHPAVFTPPFGNNTLKRLSQAIPDLTSLPTLVVPRLHRPTLPMVTITVPEVIKHSPRSYYPSACSLWLSKHSGNVCSLHVSYMSGVHANHC